MKNNKGFSLVELIIVIAIMAVLVGVLAPQYIGFVEKARVASDEQMLDSLADALLVVATEDGVIQNINTKGSDISITFDADGKADFTKDADLYQNGKGAVWLAFSEIVDTSKTYELKSSVYKGIVSEIKLVYSADNNGTKGRHSVKLVYANGGTTVLK